MRINEAIGMSEGTQLKIDKMVARFQWRFNSICKKSMLSR